MHVVSSPFSLADVTDPFAELAQLCLVAVLVSAVQAAAVAAAAILAPPVQHLMDPAGQRTQSPDGLCG